MKSNLNHWCGALAAVLTFQGTLNPAAAQTGNVGIGTASPQSQLHTTGSVRHDTLAGTGSRLVYADAQGRMFTPAPLPNTAFVHTGIPDYGCNSGNGVVSSITVSGQPTSVSSAAIRVRVDIAHAFNYDVGAYLVAPTGQVLRLIFTNGLNSQNFTNTVFWDGAPSALPVNTTGAPFTGLYKPTGDSGGDCLGTVPTVSTFAALGSGGSINPNGVWELRVYDVVAAYTGTLKNWGISFDGNSPPAPLPAFTPNAVAKGSGNNGILESSTVLYEVNGKVGIGTNSPNAPFQFSNSVTNRKIVLWENSNNDHQFYGFGINGSTLRYQTDGTGADHVFFSAASATTSNELMRIKGNGHVGIGVSPSYRLHAASAASTTAYFSSSSTDPDGVLRIEIPATSGACNTCSEFVSFMKAGSMIGSINANLSANTVSYNSTSDKRVKEDITPTHYGLQDLLRIEVKDYRMKGATKRTTGVIAQDLFGIYPEAVQEGDRGKEVQNAWAVDYGKLTPLLIKAVQEQQQEIENLRAENTAVKEQLARLETLSRQVAELRAASSLTAAKSE